MSGRNDNSANSTADDALKYASPAGGFFALGKIEGDSKYTKFLRLAYPTTRDIAGELNTKASAFITKATNRIKELMAIITTLRQEAEMARKELNTANNTLHLLLKKMAVDDGPDTIWMTGKEK
ncbi:hypothetical protein B0T22DRAFT_536453 [Podospora appendiculata]|uniref:Uncharacterized protein n=1 Tax=Podospora appendiculata TaxID=314037 RepID=A0AAE0XBI7_9PEZI|nr:hypothetical protein B0T22DRAFT_536453 [Podospora appendiculata]